MAISRRNTERRNGNRSVSFRTGEWRTNKKRHCFGALLLNFILFLLSTIYGEDLGVICILVYFSASAGRGPKSSYGCLESWSSFASFDDDLVSA